MSMLKKTKILVFFSKGPKPKNIFYYNNNVSEIVSEFNLGTVFSRNGSFCKAKKHLVEQAQKSMYI